ncbi:MAG: hypothetical protein EA388_05875 [Nitriliruptor sp.]|nr:MAG: hypothetical protein EA388_05875 [Nitriliruptor sp.]
MPPEAVDLDRDPHLRIGQVDLREEASLAVPHEVCHRGSGQPGSHDGVQRESLDVRPVPVAVIAEEVQDRDQPPPCACPWVVTDHLAEFRQ